MTACVNSNQKREGARRAVGATLAGVLAVGMVPAAAFADDADEAAAEDEGISAQAATNQQALTAATVVSAITTNNDEVTFATDGTIEVVASAEGIRGVYPTELSVANTSIKLTEQDWKDGKYTINFYHKGDITFTEDGLPTRVTNEDGSKPEPVIPKAVGDYTAVVTFNDDSNYDGCKYAFDFRITPAEIGEVTVVDKTDKDFVYNAEDQLKNAEIRVDGLKVDEDAFEISYYKKGESSDANVGLTAASWAGDYVVKVVGKPGTIYAGSTAYADFTIQQLDLATADIVINDMEIADLVDDAPDAATPDWPAPDVASINGSTNAALLSQVEATFKSSTTNTVDQPGTYTYTVAAIDPANPNIINSQDVSFNAVEQLLTADNFYYSQGQLKAEYNLDGRDSSFNTALIDVKYTDASGKEVVLPEAGYTVTVKDKKGNEVDAGNITAAGTYTVTVSVNSDYYGYKLGGKATTKVQIIAGVVQNADVYFAYDGEIAGAAATDTYDGTDLLTKLQTVVYDDLGLELTAGEDYKVKVTDAAGNVVDSVVDAGTYTVTLTSDTYDMNKQTFTLQVNPIEVTQVRVNNMLKYADEQFYSYTGEAITPVIQYKDGTNWKTLPADTYDLVLTYVATKPADVKDAAGNVTKTAAQVLADGELVDAIQNVGYYGVYVHQAEGVKNYKIGAEAGQGFLSANSPLVWVSNDKLFADVPNSEWPGKPVYQAVDLGYMQGYEGTDLFGTYDSITRGQAACLLFNMAGGLPIYDEEWFDANIGVKTSFADVDSNQYYARAIAWAAKAGVVHGYGDGTFKPDQAITREEFAAMLYNFEELVNGTPVVSDDALAEMPDAGDVSEWAEEVVAWAVENDVMGNAGYIWPQQTIIRAEAAAMAVNYQPQGVFTSPLDISK